MAAKRTGLGRGIGALIPTSDSSARPVDVFFVARGHVGLAEGAVLREHQHLLAGRVADERLGGQHVLVRRLANFLAGELVEGGLRIEAFQVAQPAGQENPDDAFRSGAMVWPSVGRRPRGCLIGMRRT